MKRAIAVLAVYASMVSCAQEETKETENEKQTVVGWNEVKFAEPCVKPDMAMHIDHDFLPPIEQTRSAICEASKRSTSAFCEFDARTGRSIPKFEYRDGKREIEGFDYEFEPWKRMKIEVRRTQDGKWCVHDKRLI